MQKDILDALELVRAARVNLDNLARPGSFIAGSPHFQIVALQLEECAQLLENIPSSPPEPKEEAVYSLPAEDLLMEDIRKAISSRGFDARTRTPDFIVAGFLVKCLENFALTLDERYDWYSKSGELGFSGNQQLKGAE